MGTGTNLQRARVVIICDPVYDPKVKAQVPKRAHRQGNPNELWYYVLTSETMIENLMEKKEAAKAEFTAEAFEFTASELLEQKPGSDVAVRASNDGAINDAVIKVSIANAAIDVDVEEDEVFDAI